MIELKVTTVSEVVPGRFVEVYNPYPVLSVSLQRINVHELTGVSYTIEGSTVIISSKLPIGMLDVVCELDAPDRNVRTSWYNCKGRGSVFYYILEELPKYCDDVTCKNCVSGKKFIGCLLEIEEEFERRLMFGTAVGASKPKK